MSLFPKGSGAKWALAALVASAGVVCEVQGYMTNPSEDDKVIHVSCAKQFNVLSLLKHDETKPKQSAAKFHFKITTVEEMANSSALSNEGNTFTLRYAVLTFVECKREQAQMSEQFAAVTVDKWDEKERKAMVKEDLWGTEEIWMKVAKKLYEEELPSTSIEDLVVQHLFLHEQLGELHFKALLAKYREAEENGEEEEQKRIASDMEKILTALRKYDCEELADMLEAEWNEEDEFEIDPLLAASVGVVIILFCVLIAVCIKECCAAKEAGKKQRRRRRRRRNDSTWEEDYDSWEEGYGSWEEGSDSWDY